MSKNTSARLTLALRKGVDVNTVLVTDSKGTRINIDVGDILAAVPLIRVEISLDEAESLAQRLLAQVQDAKTNPPPLPCTCLGLVHRRNCPEWVMPL